MSRPNAFSHWSALLTASAALAAALLQVGWSDAAAADPQTVASLADAPAPTCAGPHGAPARR